MADFLVERSFSADADTVWSKLGDFEGLGDWMPGIVKNEVEGEGIGASRKLYFNETTCVVEKLEALDEAAKSLSYSITEGPAPVVDRLYLSVGHFRDGLTMAPASARLVADLIIGRSPAVDPSPYDPVRRMATDTQSTYNASA